MPCEAPRSAALTKSIDGRMIGVGTRCGCILICPWSVSGDWIFIGRAFSPGSNSPAPPASSTTMLSNAKGTVLMERMRVTRHLRLPSLTLVHTVSTVHRVG